jgi:hypothetical protein
MELRIVREQGRIRPLSRSSLCRISLPATFFVVSRKELLEKKLDGGYLASEYGSISISKSHFSTYSRVTRSKHVQALKPKLPRKKWSMQVDGSRFHADFMTRIFRIFPAVHDLTT